MYYSTIFGGEFVKDIRIDKKVEYRIKNIGFVSALRNENFTYEYKTGKERFSLINVESGEMEYYFPISKEKMKIGKGQLLSIPEFYPYEARYLKDNTVIRMFLFEPDTENIPEFLVRPVLRYESRAVEIFNSVSNINLQNHLFLSSKIYELLYILENSSSVIPKKYKKVAGVTDEIKEKYFENEKLKYYADMCDMSETNFRKLFKEYTGKSPIEYRNMIRISQAKRMIDSGEFNVSEAAYLTGFNNMSFFYRIYNRYFN